MKDIEKRFLMLFNRYFEKDGDMKKDDNVINVDFIEKRRKEIGCSKRCYGSVKR